MPPSVATIPFDPPPCHLIRALLTPPGQTPLWGTPRTRAPHFVTSWPLRGPPQPPPLEGLAPPKDGGAGQGTRCPSAAARRRLSVPGQDGLRVPPGSPGQRHACQAGLGEAWGGDTPHLALFTVKPEPEGCRWATSQEQELAAQEGSGGDVADPKKGGPGVPPPPG